MGSSAVRDMQNSGDCSAERVAPLSAAPATTARRVRVRVPVEVVSVAERDRDAEKERGSPVRPERERDRARRPQQAVPGASEGITGAGA